MDRITRRDFIRVSTLAGAATLAAACAQPVTAPPSEAPTTVPPSEPTAAPVKPAARFNEAPMLAEKVAAGELPPVDERVPENPFAIEGLDGIGNYGGTWRMQKRGQADGFARGQVLNRGTLNFNQDVVLHPYLAESYEATPDGTEWTFTLRKGLKWSDGAPLTSEDYRFYYEDLILNKEYTRAPAKWLASLVEGEYVPCEFIVHDDLTFTYKFARPNTLFNIQNPVANNIAAVPAHFLKPVHPDYGDQAEIDSLIAGNESWDDWTMVLGDKNNPNLTIERPTHEPWINTNVWSDELVYLERNPYFWEVDTAGHQLPYFDKLQYRDFTDTEVAVMRVANGEVDCQIRHIGFPMTHYTVLKEGEATGDYTVLLWKCPWTFAAHFNMTCKDQRLRELFQERDFRVAMSLAADRDEMRELLYSGYGANRQHVPPEGTPYYYEKLAKAYIEYDPDQSNALLDGLGITERDADGYRLWNDGSGDRVSFLCISGADPSEDVLLLVDYFKAVGIQMTTRTMDRALSIQMADTNETQMTTTWFARNVVPLCDPTPWTKYAGPAERPIFAAWSAWYVDPNDPIAEKPPDGHWVWDLWGPWEEIQQTADADRQKELFFSILDVWAEELPCPSYYGDMPVLCPTKNGFKGIHGGYWWDCCVTVYEHIIDNATWYWDKPEDHTA